MSVIIHFQRQTTAHIFRVNPNNLKTIFYFLNMLDQAVDTLVFQIVNSVIVVCKHL